MTEEEKNSAVPPATPGLQNSTPLSTPSAPIPNPAPTAIPPSPATVNPSSSTNASLPSSPVEAAPLPPVLSSASPSQEGNGNSEPAPSPQATPLSPTLSSSQLPPENKAQDSTPASPLGNNVGISSSEEAHTEEEAEGKSKSQPAFKLTETLIERGLISRDQVQIALLEQKANKGPHKLLGSILVEMGFITESALGEVLAESSGVKNLDLNSAVLDPKLFNLIPKEVAMRCKAIPLAITEENVSIAMADVYNILAIDQMRKYFPKHLKIVPVYSSENQILEIIDQYYHYDMSIDGILKEIETGISEQKTFSGEDTGYVNPTVRLVDAFLVDGIKSGASDLHFEPENSFVRLRYRIDGKLRQIRSFHKEYWSAIVVRIKILSGMNIAENRNPQDGRISYNVLGREVDFRVATHPTIHGENIVMRVLDKRSSIVPLDKLGFSEKNAVLLRKLLKRPEGIIIVTGPTGSGKTTTLYSILNYINTIEKNIMTLEDPVEYQLSLIRQSGIREHAGMNFTTGIKSLMRQDPDIIFVGEVRDAVTATMAVRAAMTGHQVFTTLHTNDALGSVPRLVDIGVPHTLLSGSLICVIAQRLARKLCEHCKQPAVATAEECRILGVSAENPPTIFKKVGCEKCDFLGYKGRIGISEVLGVDKGLDELIATQATYNTMKEYAVAHGFQTMVDDGVSKVLSGITDLESLINTIDMTGRL